MPSINVDFLHSLKDNYTHYPVFIESGTLNGETTFQIEPLFDEVYTVEINERFYKRVVEKYKGNKIQFILGNSSQKFIEFLPMINKPAIFFLDGHWSGGDTGRCEKDCPLYEELDIINKMFKHEAILIVDDMRLCGKGPRKGTDICDWEDINITNLKKVVAERTTDSYLLPSSYAPEDRLIIHLRKL